jgi:hypothetical protein
MPPPFARINLTPNVNSAKLSEFVKEIKDWKETNNASAGRAQFRQTGPSRSHTRDRRPIAPNRVNFG